MSTAIDNDYTERQLISGASGIERKTADNFISNSGTKGDGTVKIYNLIREDLDQEKKKH